MRAFREGSMRLHFLLHAVVPAAMFALAAPASGAIVDRGTGPTEMPDEVAPASESPAPAAALAPMKAPAPAESPAPAAAFAPMAAPAPAEAFALSEASVLSEPSGPSPGTPKIRVAVHNTGWIERVLESDPDISATRLDTIDPGSLDRFDCVVARIFSFEPASVLDEIRAFVDRGGCFIGEWWGAGSALSGGGRDYASPYFKPTRFLGLFSGLASDGYYVANDNPIAVVQNHPVVADLPASFSAYGSTEFFVRALPPYDPRLTTLATYRGFGGTYPAIMVGDTGTARAVLFFFDAGDEPTLPAMATLWLNAVRWGAARNETKASFSGTRGNNGWWVSDVAVTLAAADGSGVVASEYRLDGGEWLAYAGQFVVAKEGRTTLCYRSTGNSGDPQTEKCATLSIDKSPPAVSISIATPADGATYLLRQPVEADWTATDAVSGLAAAFGTAPSGGPADTSTVGEKAFYVVAEDAAGNVARASAAYRVVYAFGGFLPPILPDGSGVHRLGSVVPVKFQVRDFFGAAIADAAAALSVAKVSGATSGASLVDAVASGSANDGNRFRYDPSTEQYVFNLSTREASLTAGTWLLWATLDDGSTFGVDVGLR